MPGAAGQRVVTCGRCGMGIRRVIPSGLTVWTGRRIALCGPCLESFDEWMRNDDPA
jgi:hypothetical protein